VHLHLPASKRVACLTFLQARIELLALVGQLYGSLQARFDAEDTAQLFMWIEKACRNPWSGECS
jgi:hypothetical protein